MKVIDVVKEPEWQSSLLEKIKRIDNHFNAGNYKGFEDRLNQYESFTIVLKDDAIVAMSGLFNGGIYPTNISRILDRTYYFDRPTNGFDPEYHYASRYMLPYQLEVAEQLGKDAVFISVQSIKKRRALLQICRHSPNIFEPLDDLYNTCRLINGCRVNEEVLCWQNIAIHKFNDDYELELPKITQDEYRERYKEDLKTIR